MPTPGPVAYQVQFGFLGVLSDVSSLCPRRAVVVAVGDPDGAGAGFVGGLELVAGGLAGVLGEQQPDGSGVAVEDGGGVADGVLGVVGDDLDGFPGCAVVEAAAEEQVDVAGVAATVLASFAEGEDGAVLAW